MGVMVAVFAVGQFSGAHLNPAVTIGFAVIGDTEWSDVPKYFGGEFVGAFIGATLVWLAYLPHWAVTEDPGLKLACYSTAPAIRNTAANLICEIIGTFVLVFGVLAILRQPVTGGDRPRRPTRRPAGVRHRAVARRTDGLRDQPGTRSGAADHARDPADRGQGALGLGLLLGPGARSDDRRGVLGGLAFDWWYPG